MALALLLTACAGPAPNYAPSIDNVEALKKSGATPVKTGALAVDPGLKSGAAIGLRANTMVSGIGKHFGDYIEAALRQELELARLYDPQSGVEISGTLMRNDINAGGMSTNDGVIAVRFLVRQGMQTRFDKVKEVRHQWASSFAGAVAIPTAANNYPVMVQMLFAQLIADPEFTAALRP
jgi:hypothetical protein